MTSKEIISTLKQPEKTAELADLIYVPDAKFTIIRKPYGKGFTYFKENKRIKSKKLLKRINSLVIPPKWSDVKISQFENGHLQAVGRDAKHRKVYKYHPLWTEVRNQTKFLKMVSFGKALPKIRNQVETDLSQKGMPKTKVLAIVVKLMEETHIRVGNAYYAKRNQTYGLSTLRSRHLDVDAHKIRFHFVGKRGKEHSITIRNKRLIKLVNQCEEIPGWELFNYFEKGEKHRIDSSMVNDYIHQLSGYNFSAKDFRTWAASKIFFESLSELPAPKTTKEKDKNLLYGIDQAAQALGNTRNVCRAYYIHPTLIELYEDTILSQYFEKYKTTEESTDFTSSEKVLLELYAKYEIRLDSAKPF